MNVNKEWTGNRNSIYTTLGASNHSDKERQSHDYYATEPKATELLLAEENFAPVIWECACGEGHMAKVLEEKGYQVISTDVIYRGYGNEEPVDFLHEPVVEFDGDIITNPPYKYALAFVEKALESKTGKKSCHVFETAILGRKEQKAVLFDTSVEDSICQFIQTDMCHERGV